MPFHISLRKHGEVYRKDAGLIISLVSRLAEHFGDSMEKVIGEYSDRVREQVRDQKEFNRTGRYRYSQGSQIREIVEDAEFKKKDLYTLALSYILSPYRYELLLYVRSFADTRISAGEACLQVGTGIGLEAYLADRRMACIDTYDINPYSALCLSYLGVSPRVRFFPEEYRFQPSAMYDHCLAVELMEHLEDPAGFLAKMKRVMKRGGSGMLTFALRMPQIDHIFCFKTVSEARALVENGGLEIIGENYFISSFLGMDEARKAALAESSPFAAVYACVVINP